jgi:hypothetical protein
MYLLLCARSIFGIETGIGEKSTAHNLMFWVLWKSINGKPRKVYTFTPIDTILKKSIMAFMQVHILVQVF